MNRIVALSFILIILLGTGCVNKRIAYQDIQPDEGKAVIYVYRPHSFVNSAETMILEVNDVEIDTLANGGYRYAMVTPGNVKLLVKQNVIPFNEYGAISLKEVQANKSYYVKADPVPFGGFDMILMDESIGRQEASETGLYVPQ